MAPRLRLGHGHIRSIPGVGNFRASPLPFSNERNASRGFGRLDSATYILSFTHGQATPADKLVTEKTADGK
ncbi:hypothetical protein M413DRAFT_449690 [Hebeloma cylindrosporum]|uniref:Uncharacterized protein n=1 Tax=Hebeloma cylindrosporum TaxID=76867 RepID=A0A0C2XC83_HEBCY|nr:hypothetical protein M413DRAFT_449690 [Hebeloma cylindrosporum h7]